jgi:hypothetical protein
VQDTPRKRQLGFLQGAAVLTSGLKADVQNDIATLFN